MSVRYKFKSEKIFSQILFDGTSITVGDVKKEIYRQRRLGRSENVDLMISNAETTENYPSDEILIPKNASLIVLRVPAQSNTKVIKKQQEQPQVPSTNDKISAHKVTSTNLATMKGTEEEKIFAMMMQSTLDYQYSVPKFSSPPSTYVCRKCHVPGHWIRNCPFSVTKSQRFDPKQRKESTKMTGIPVSMRNKTDSKQFYSSDLTRLERPKTLLCQICSDSFRNPVTMPCCKTTYCYECAVLKLLESDESDCPKCSAKFIQPGMLEVDVEMKKMVENTISFGSKFLVESGRNVAGICA